MSFETVLRIEDAPNSGAWNMAVDEALLDLAAQSGIATVRIYAWDQPTLSLGYFQDVGGYQCEERWNQLPAVRRLTGGGAILHHHEITYSCCLPAQAFKAFRPIELYSRVHQAAIDVLAAHNMLATFRGDMPGDDSQFLCFTRGDERDVLLGGKKILGSAQRRRRGAVLQHGSLITRTSEHAPEITGAFDIADCDVPLHALKHNLGKSIVEAACGVPYTREPELSDQLRQEVSQLLPKYIEIESR